MTKSINILLITADQWRAECLSTLGHPVLKTPHLDAPMPNACPAARAARPCSPACT